MRNIRLWEVKWMQSKLIKLIDETKTLAQEADVSLDFRAAFDVKISERIMRKVIITVTITSDDRIERTTDQPEMLPV